MSLFIISHLRKYEVDFYTEIFFPPLDPCSYKSIYIYSKVHVGIDLHKVNLDSCAFMLAGLLTLLSALTPDLRYLQHKSLKPMHSS